MGTKGIEGKVAKLILYIHHTLHAPSGGHNVFSGQSSSEIQFPAISRNVLPSLFIVRFVMRQCSALEFRSHALTFSGNRRLLVTTVHFGALHGLERHITTFGLSVSAMANRNMKILQMKLHLEPKTIVALEATHKAR